MKRFILTGAPGAGKTAIIRQLEMEGFSVVEEAATDIIALSQAQGIAEPWKDQSFISAILDLQQKRVARASDQRAAVQFHDRSAVCTAALATYLEYPLSGALSRELEHIQSNTLFEKRVFFIQNLGFVAPTEARRISFAESLRFERIHEELYRSLGFEIVFVSPGSVKDRVAAIRQLI